MERFNARIIVTVAFTAHTAAADALIVDQNGKLQLPDAALCSIYEQAKHSVKTLASYDITTIICYHGGLYSENANEAIAALIGD